MEGLVYIKTASFTFWVTRRTRGSGVQALEWARESRTEWEKLAMKGRSLRIVLLVPWATLQPRIIQCVEMLIPIVCDVNRRFQNLVSQFTEPGARVNLSQVSGLSICECPFKRQVVVTAAVVLEGSIPNFPKRMQADVTVARIRSSSRAMVNAVEKSN